MECGPFLGDGWGRLGTLGDSGSGHKTKVYNFFKADKKMITEKLSNFGKFPGTKITSGTIEQHGTENQAFSETQCFSHFCVFRSFAENAAKSSYYYIFGPNLHWNITKQPYIEKMTITEMKIYIWVRSRRNSVSPIVPKRPQSVPQRPHRDLAAKVES